MKILAFLSCSLDEKDKPFISAVENKLKEFDVFLDGTVGLHYQKDENLTTTIFDRIKSHKLAIVCATKRHQMKNEKYHTSESVIFESGAAKAINIPVIFFVEVGVEVPLLIANSTQYIIFNGTPEHLEEKHEIIKSMVDNAKIVIQKNETNPDNDIVVNNIINNNYFTNNYSTSLVIQDEDNNLLLYFVLGVLCIAIIYSITQKQ